MATAKKLPSGNYRVLVYTGKDASGKRQYKSFTDPDKRTAEFLASEYLTRNRRGRVAAHALSRLAASERLGHVAARRAGQVRHGARRLVNQCRAANRLSAYLFGQAQGRR